MDELMTGGKSHFDGKLQNANRLIAEYLMQNEASFRELSHLRQEGWNAKEGDHYFEDQRQRADNSDANTAWDFYLMMQNIGRELSTQSSCLQIPTPSSIPKSILDLCMAPGGFLHTALALNPQCAALAFSLPPSDGGHHIFLDERAGVEVKLLDITMLATDMGVTEIPAEHADNGKFILESQFHEAQYDLVFCDGQVLRTHCRASYREKREARRLTVTQLALALQHVKHNGTIVMLLHKVEACGNASLLHQFSRFSTVELFKPKKYHAKRSSFYMIATNINATHPDAVAAIASWKDMWRIATFGTDDEYNEAIEKDVGADRILQEFGRDLARMGRDIWSTQAAALKRAPFMRK